MKIERLRDNNIKINGMSKDEVILYLMNKYGEEIKRFVYFLTVDWDQAADITQQTFIEVYQELDRAFKHPSIRYFIYSMSIQKVKERNRWTFTRELFVSYSFRSNEEILNEDQLLYEAIINLPVRYKEIITLIYYCNFSVEEVSGLLSTKKSRVMSLLDKGKGRLQRSLETQGGDFSWEII
ncbi:sigma factor-like helix-turn-helix DNA-binding protein [Fictibacillus nanhaiensis]|uniref:sigma factor-like helix-turn-helix DNA-binding protein n=1 Tax=Fictibacillus nanhaiensis TaxID=742169 RepID=UPI002E205702|nr:sigma factor-like helix-turn-helix DNA-binding protein [Fictibacillus nanhaiensis]MED1863893.1 sigma factor-like helix-turn-helix DNA-binding protein [Fictibacillus nanhaiensis]